MNDPVLSIDVFDWPEWHALALRLGIPTFDTTKAITIRLAVDEAVSVSHEFYGFDPNEKTP